MVDYINRGTDPRILGKVGAVVQTALSFHASDPPTAHTFRIGGSEVLIAWPPFLSVAIARKAGHYASFRIGWRWDKNWGRGGYIADVILKPNIDHLVHY